MTWNILIEEQELGDFPFSNDTLKYLDERYIEVGTPTIGSVDLSKVVGTAHPDYCGKTWGQLKPVKGTLEGDFLNKDIAFQPLKRAIANMQNLRRKPDYYLNEDPKHEWSFYDIGGDYYISTGNNRTIIGHFFLHLNGLPPIIHGVKVTPARFIATPEVPQQKSGVAKKIREWLKRALRTS